jgi:hypothetical protein
MIANRAQVLTYVLKLSLPSKLHAYSEHRESGLRASSKGFSLTGFGRRLRSCSKPFFAGVAVSLLQGINPSALHRRQELVKEKNERNIAVPVKKG